ncbi:metallophosphoesterase family protein [Chloroflexota bacterium]
MRILVISDIHANLTALETVLTDAGEFDAAWCLGDLVGYGPDPNECIAKVSVLPNLRCIIGNHDAAALNQIDTKTFNKEARQALEWTQKILSESSISFLSSLQQKIEINNVTLTHGSPRHPVWEYLMDSQTATLNFDYFSTPYCFVGHTHLPVVYTRKEKKLVVYKPTPNNKITLSPRTIINPGSVGQPRDHDPRAAYVIYNPEENTWDYRRLTYDIPAVQTRMVDAQLPERHIVRLQAGW